MIKDIKELFSVIPNYPGLNIALVDNFALKEEFVRFCNSQEATLYLKDFDNSLDKSLNSEFVKVEKFDFSDKRYNFHSVLYDFVFVCYDVEELPLKEVVKKFYRVIKNAGYLYLFVQNQKVDEVINLLEETNFVSLNVIDSFKDTKVISAQKMHGWMKV